MLYKRSTSTEDGSLNQRQVEGGVQILEFLVPLFLDVMMGHPEMAQKEYWGNSLTLSDPIFERCRRKIPW